ncbi:oxidoreductase [Kaistia sp. 32K]|uniref:SDR family NAD(P)-dependent oxidoreductase n=1 Tax=Kaistia sp. 32K TaxID=2795690 RepID=UPI0019165710|nr:SDR family NAD(P)-dependent oxidoreductase [Kaistia sp. 32K]BCP51404.1 oxidoreductase [Kaistia sp. 32K]
MNFAKYPSLSGRVVLVTGGASGIGADIVRAYAGSDAKVVFVDIQEEAGEALADELKGSQHKPVFRRCDLTDVEATQAVIAGIGRDVGPIAVLVNNAANDDRREVDEVTPDYWDWSQSINLRPQFFTAQAVRPQMRQLGYGSIINFSSIAWRGGAPNMPAYTAAKAAILGLTRSLARAFGADNIRVNAIEPGAVMTEKQHALWYKTPESVDALVRLQCIRKVLQGDEIARTALFLGADDSRMITKQSIIVDGGLI